MKTWEPDECLAAIIVIGCLVLIALGIDGEVKAILSMGAAWIFGRRYSKIKGKGDRNAG